MSRTGTRITTTDHLVAKLSRRAEDVLFRIARAGTTPLPYSQLASLITEPDEHEANRAIINHALDQIVERHRHDDLKHLTAFVVLADTGEVGDGYGRIGILLPPEQARQAAHAAVRTAVTEAFRERRLRG